MSCDAIYSLKMDAASPCKMFVYINHAVWHRIPEGCYVILISS